MRHLWALLSPFLVQETDLFPTCSSHLHLLLFPSLAHLALIARPSHTSLDARTKAVLDRLQALHPNVEIEHSCVEGYDRGQAVHNADLILCWYGSLYSLEACR